MAADAPRELSAHYTCTVTARQAGEPSNPGQAGDKLLRIHKTIAGINILLF